MDKDTGKCKNAANMSITNQLWFRSFKRHSVQRYSGYHVFPVYQSSSSLLSSLLLPFIVLAEGLPKMVVFFFEPAAASGGVIKSPE